jgi:hypothetical protein
MLLIENARHLSEKNGELFLPYEQIVDRGTTIA